jgi:hypothetical protein
LVTEKICSIGEIQFRITLWPMARKTYGRTRKGKPITDEMLEELADEAEAGLELSKLKRRPGRPPIGSGPADVVPVRLDPELRAQLTARAEADGETTSEVIRRALRSYLDVA